MKYNLILLDLDDTLMDFAKCEQGALKKLFSDLGISSTSENHNLFHKVNKAVWDLFEKGEIKQSEINFQRFSRFFNHLSITEGINVQRSADLYLELLATEHHLIEGALDFIQTLNQNFKLAILTNGFKKVQLKRLSDSGILTFFDRVFISEEMGYSKPNANAFYHVISHYQDLRKNEILMVGDSLGSDILGANNAGIDSCWINFKNMPTPTHISPNFTAYNYKEILNWLI